MGLHDFSVKCRHVEKETKHLECNVEGSLPKWLNGYVVFNGPGVFKVGDAEYIHGFDGSAILQKFTIENGNVSYCSKFLRSESYEANKKSGKIMFSEFATPGPSQTNQGILSRIFKAMDYSNANLSDNAFQTILQMGPRYYAQAQTPFYHEIDLKTLDVVDRVNMLQLYKVNVQTVDIMQDKEGYYYSLGLTAKISGMKYALLKFPKDGNVAEGKVVATFSCRWRFSPSYIHSAAMTENHLIFIETPLTVSIMDWLSEFGSAVPFVDILKWNEEKKGMIRVVELGTWRECATKYLTEPFFNLYYGNVYEELNHIVVDVCAYKDSSLIDHMYVNVLKDQSKKATNNHASFIEAFSPYLRRFVIPLNYSDVTEQKGNLVTLPNTSCAAFKEGNEIHLTYELRSEVPFGAEPTRSPRLALAGKGKFLYNYFGGSEEAENFNYLGKVNVDTTKALLFHEEDLYPTKPIFVPSPDGEDEDDGLLLVMCVRSSDPNYLALVILAAKTMTEICRIHSKLETEAPFPIYGAFSLIKQRLII